MNNISAKPIQSMLAKIGKWCDAESHVIFLNCTAGLMEKLMWELVEVFGCKVTGPNQVETGFDYLHKVVPGYSYTTYHPDNSMVVSDSRPF